MFKLKLFSLVPLNGVLEKVFDCGTLFFSYCTAVVYSDGVAGNFSCHGRSGPFVLIYLFPLPILVHVTEVFFVSLFV